MKQRFSFSFLVFCLFYCFFFDSFYACGQGFGCTYKWKPSYIIGVETVKTTIPEGFWDLPNPGNIFYSGKNTSIPLTFRFGDIDERKAKGKDCDNNNTKWTLKQFEPENYRMTFSSNSANATFGGQPTITVNCVKLTTKHNNSLNFDYSVMENTPVSLTIDDDWTGDKDIEISVKIVDNADVVEARDDDYNAVVWKARWAGTNFPNNLKLETCSPISLQWGTWVGFNAPTTGKFEYEALPDIGSPGLGDYSYQTIAENFTGPFATDIFTMDNINMAWAISHQITTADAVASNIFKFANPATFLLSASDKFIDEHQVAIVTGTVTIPISELSSVFTQDAITNRRVGFKLNQLYINANGVTIKNTTINRKASGEIINGNCVLNNYEFKKTH